ncbi:MAG: phosphoribosylformylglycinamidine cyclo-ligase [Bradymonadaceae bacterium]|nr:phosphoribosylformylglycinamidine cyclo-ligase [Lujinxingiaceae bacterium]
MSKSKSSQNTASSYREAGVDLDAGQDAVERYKALVARTFIPGVMANIGGFGGLFSLREAGVQLGDTADPVLVSGTDGVGTKLKIAFELDRHDTIGIDCVAMCVNDVICCGARPLFFLDYLATGKLVPAQAEAIVAGISKGCVESGCALIGGETAEMPGFYAAGEYDIAGFCVGVVDRAQMISPERARLGDMLIGIASSGIHSNGYSLVRKIVADAGLDLTKHHPALGADKTLGEVLLEPTRIYVKAVQILGDALDVSGLAHITGGGFHENIPRILPDGLSASIQIGSWPIPKIFGMLQDAAELADDEIYHVFNMGIGMIASVRGDVDQAIDSLAGAGYPAWVIGQLVEGDGGVRLIKAAQKA